MAITTHDAVTLAPALLEVAAKKMADQGGSATKGGRSVFLMDSKETFRIRKNGDEGIVFGLVFVLFSESEGEIEATAERLAQQHQD